MSRRSEKIEEILRETAAEFLNREAAAPPSGGLITVTRAVLNEKNTHATVMFTVFPDSAEESALNFANRHRGEFADFFEKRVRGIRAPHLIFTTDKGEKNRRRLDELS